MSGALDKKATKTASKLIKKFGDIITYTEISTIYNSSSFDIVVNSGKSTTFLFAILSVNYIIIILH